MSINLLRRNLATLLQHFPSIRSDNGRAVVEPFGSFGRGGGGFLEIHGTGVHGIGRLKTTGVWMFKCTFLLRLAEAECCYMQDPFRRNVV